tara:strand:+ start:329 stop:679 length:351 start_codon:yes stop_codon:yes gene_type:complete
MNVIDHRKSSLTQIVGMEPDETLAAHYGPRLRQRLGFGKERAFPSCYNFVATYGHFLVKDGSKLPGARVEIQHEILNLAINENWTLHYIHELLDPKDKALDDLVKRAANSFRASVL